MNDFSLGGLGAQIIEHRLLTLCIILLLLAAGIAYKKWDDVRYFCMRVWHVMPLVGTVAKASRQYSSRSSLVHQSKWLDAEMNIADLYYNEYVAADQDITYYNQCKDYLAKVLESGRKKAPVWVTPLIVVLLVMEAIGFAYVLGPFMAPRISANNLQIVVWSLALILSLISGFIAHHAGAAQHYNSLLRKANRWFSQSDSKKNLNEVSEIQIVHTYRDNDEPRYNQIAARISIDHDCAEHRRPVWGFYAWILIIAIAAFGVRYYTLQMVESKQSVTSMQSSNDVSSPWGSVLPAQAAQNDQQARLQAENDMQQSKHDASLVTFIILSVIYIGVQFFAFFLGRNYGFAGVHSSEAWHSTHRFPNAQAMRSWMERRKRAISMHADHKLSMLRRKLMHKTTTSAEERELLKQSLNRDFESYVRQKQAGLEQERENSRRKELEDYKRNQKLDSDITRHNSAGAGHTIQPAATVIRDIPAEDTQSQAAAPVSDADIKPLEYPDITEVEAGELIFLANIYPSFSGLTEQQITFIWKAQCFAKKRGLFAVA
ncbi:MULTISPECIES: hypothetical protein [unclassified Tatumella]|uniref:hypothetical protein n=1 Tax=unclassified Tatumella TaxID=2649542 RepID=UPI001BAF1F33|nr:MULTISPECIES: hypothetical protein [unclassified Tatumella]MBS0857404.1 hypothetical protein [Tatumella sp. JGM16]MBS0877296.1 hypothetical protein [Tatumella sp. JGM82]MBS0890831.1 hypothetical protein [Tatumella sp. JGM94]MBS0893382.1 hypothetical protein [Tatumella sp. JGM130]MBS0901693.1 hypothetical protein [Tatumella sp. JGM100]